MAKKKNNSLRSDKEIRTRKKMNDGLNWTERMLDELKKYKEDE